MAGLKKIAVAAKLGPKFTMETNIRNHIIRVDQPKMAGGDDMGPTPLEYQLVALAGCIGAIGRIVANQRRLPLRSMDIQVDGELDVDVLLGKAKEPRSGFTSIRALVKIDADMTPDEKREFLHEVDARCPISDNLARGTTVSVDLLE